MVRLGVLLAVLFSTLATAAAAETPALRGVTGPDFTITLADASGKPVTHLDAGSYAVHVDDLSDFHNFHLVGSGVDERTSVVDTGSVDWAVKLVDGTYTFLCDVHPTSMKKTFTVGTPPPPPPPPPSATLLKGSVGPGPKISFARSAPAGAATLTIRDLTAKDNFHLRGPGVNKQTGVAFTGPVTWTVTLQPGTYTFRSDAHKKLGGTTKVT
jgi:plastocyanin